MGNSKELEMENKLKELEKDVKVCKEKLEETQKVIENFRASFRSIESLILNMKQKNHLR